MYAVARTEHNPLLKGTTNIFKLYGLLRKPKLYCQSGTKELKTCMPVSKLHLEKYVVHKLKYNSSSEKISQNCVTASEN